MGRRQTQWNLLKNSIAAYYAAIELHNKPSISYRYETTTLLMTNAWELLLKAYVRRYAKKSIFCKDGTTISYAKALHLTSRQLDKDSPGFFLPIEKNLALLGEYRNSFAHFYGDSLDPVIFLLLAKAAENYVSFYERFFGKNPLEGSNLHILPLGFELPFEPEMFLSKKSPCYSASKDTADFIDSITRTIEDLNSEGVKDSVVIGLDVHFASTKDISNADLIARLERENGVPFSKVKSVRLSSEKGAAPVYLSDAEFFEQYPLTYDELTSKCREAVSSFKVSARYHTIRKEYVDKNYKFAASKSLNKDHSNSRMYYNHLAVEEIKRQWKLAGDNTQDRVPNVGVKRNLI